MGSHNINESNGEIKREKERIEKKKDRQTERQKKEKGELQRRLCCVYCGAYSLSLRAVSCPSGTPSEETKFSLANGYQLVIASGLGMECKTHSFRELKPSWAQWHMCLSFSF